MRFSIGAGEEKKAKLQFLYLRLAALVIFLIRFFSSPFRG
jgi:hypothetical protein